MSKNQSFAHVQKRDCVPLKLSFALGPSRTRGQFQICSGQIGLEIGQWPKICPETYSRTREKIWEQNIMACCKRHAI